MGATQPNSDRVWIGTASGLFTCKPSPELQLCINTEQENIRAIALNSDNSETVWVLSWSRGISKFQSNDFLEDYHFQPPNLPLLLAIGQDGYPYVLTRALWRLKKENYEKISQGIPSDSRV
ncbi:MAG: hypothetical protein ACHBN1_31545 [Heteroscytonema crispum UTEX LB 1556]